MDQAINPDREETKPEDRMSRLSQAILRINEYLDFDEVLQEVVDSARSLIGARYCALAVIDESGELQGFVLSGLDQEEQEAFLNLPEGQELFSHFSRLAEPIRITDFRGLARSLGFSTLRLPLRVDDVFSFLAVPLLYQGRSSGNIYMAQKEAEDEFRQEDEETLVMFAAQAALVISNARKVPGRTAGKKSRGDTRQRLTGRRCSLRHQDRSPRLLQPRGGSNYAERPVDGS